MTSKEFKAFLARAVKEKFLTSEEAVSLLARFRNHELRDADLSQPLSEAVRSLKEPKDTKKSLAGLLLILKRQYPDATDPEEILDLSYKQRIRIREQLQDHFISKGTALASLYALNRNTAGWQREFTNSIYDNLIQQSSVGHGRILTKQETRTLSGIIGVQTAFSSRFADEVSARALLGTYYTSEGMSARSTLYAGQGRAEWYKGSEAELEDGYVVDYLAMGDACAPCAGAAADSPYLPEEGPMPGEICRGGGRCRCDRQLRFDPAEAARLRN